MTTIHDIRAGNTVIRIRCSDPSDQPHQPPLVLLPGLGRPSEDLDPFAARLTAAGYPVLQPDPRGLGGSTGKLDGLTLHDLAADVAAVIVALAPGGAIVIGHAFGNRIARMLAADRPDLVDTVVLLGCSGLVQPTPAIAEAIRLAQAVDTPTPIRAKAVQDAWFGPNRDIAIWMDGWSQPVMRAYLAAAAATETASWWTAGSARVMIVQGADDPSAPPENGWLLQREIGNRASLIDLPGVSHAGPVEAPDAVAKVVLAFLARPQPSEAAP